MGSFVLAQNWTPGVKPPAGLIRNPERPTIGTQRTVPPVVNAPPPQAGANNAPAVRPNLPPPRSQYVDVPEPPAGAATSSTSTAAGAPPSGPPRSAPVGPPRSQYVDVPEPPSATIPSSPTPGLGSPFRPTTTTRTPSQVPHRRDNTAPPPRPADRA